MDGLSMKTYYFSPLSFFFEYMATISFNYVGIIFSSNKKLSPEPFINIVLGELSL